MRKPLDLPSPDRRRFLKTSGLAALAASLPANAASIAASPDDRQSGTAAPASDPVSDINLLQGTDSTISFSRGNTLPIAAMPFGMAHWTLQSFEDSPWMFHPAERRMQGFRSTNQLSPWLGDYGQATFLPFSGYIKPGPGQRASSFRPEESVLLPHSMRLRLLRYGIDAELVPTERCALIHATYSGDAECGFLIDIPEGHAENVSSIPAERVIRFTSSANSGGVPKHFATYYVMKFSLPWERVDTVQQKDRSISSMMFAARTQSLDVRIATSFISFEQAAANLERELGEDSLDTVRQKGASVWNAHLNRIEIEGATSEQRKTFRSCMYRTLLFPRIWHEPDAAGHMQHRSPYTGEVVPGVMYADHGYWDVYRAWYPMMTLLFPERLGEILQAWVNAYKEGGWLPQFPCPGYRACMTGSLIDSVFGEAAAKGIQGFDLQAAYEGLRKHATGPGNPAAGYGRRGVEEYMAHGYVPADRVQQSVAETADAAYGDFCIAQVAKAAGKQDDYQMFMRRSKNWRNLLDTQTGFLRGKLTNGQWMEPFDPITWGNPYVEGAAWQHRWDAPHDIPALIEAQGGKEEVVEYLDTMLAMPPIFHTGDYGYEIHEMSEMAAVNFGQYAHSNQPVHHVLGVYAAAGRPDRTQFWAHKVLNELYSPEHFAGDEDTGSMAAWYVLNALGIFVLCPAKA
ncbi:MAG TPA: GH92 family glycosyl hydrolase, partial [Pseudacidobacterium sp.]|nr:GH92 family glycosyl hydrolase [Pseudacidobacterium sp.]